MTPTAVGSEAGPAASTWSRRPLRLVNLVAFIPLLLGNALAGSGALSGESIGVIANRWQTLVLPSNWTFGIWSLIYVALGGFVGYQAFSKSRGGSVAGRVGPLWLVTVVLNLAWITAFSFSQFGVALLIMVLLLASLVVLWLRLGIGVTPVGIAERLLVQAPFSLYLGWIAVALIVNSAQFLSYLGWEGGFLSPITWALILMTAATAIAALFAVMRREWIVPLVVAWALIGIAFRNPEDQVLLTSAWGLAGINAVWAGLGRLWRRESPRL